MTNFYSYFYKRTNVKVNMERKQHWIKLPVDSVILVYLYLCENHVMCNYGT